ncbi:MAG TPA: S8 family serine peptidase [Actinomycetes bacterium]|nr:S8 family serine peptidase [Actinomycetes bacterium]
MQDSSYSPRKRDGLTYQQRLAADLGHRTWDGAVQVAPGPDYWYVPGEVLLSTAAEDRFHGLLQRFAKPDQESNEVMRRGGVDVRRWLLGDHDVPALVATLQRLADDDPEVSVAPNHVLRGGPKYKGGPATEPEPVAAMALGEDRPRTDGAQIAVLDTGVWAGWTSQLPLREVVVLGPDDIDVLDADHDGILDTEAGHGTFICGLVAQVAPALRIDPGRVLDPTGIGTDFSVALELLRTEAPVINLSLGCYTAEDRAPLALDGVLGALGPDRVVVAAAGNDATTRPFWPAAFKHVVAVGALDTTDPDHPRPAAFSNHGSWVDVWAPGVDLASTYVDGHWRTADEDAQFAGWAKWSGTSFAAPLVAAEIARRAVNGSARAAMHDLLAELPVDPVVGLVYSPPVDVVAR